MIKKIVNPSTVYTFKTLRDLLYKSRRGIDAQVRVSHKSPDSLAKIVSVLDINTNRVVIKKEINPDATGYNFAELELTMIADLVGYGVGAIWHEEDKRLQLPFAELKSVGKHEVVKDEDATPEGSWRDPDASYDYMTKMLAGLPKPQPERETNKREPFWEK